MNDATHDLPKVLRAPLQPGVGLLLESRIPARLAWVDDGAPHVVPIWFAWTGSHLAMTSFAGAAKLDAIVEGAPLAVTIDTEDFPYRSLKIRGTAELRPTEGLADEYVAAADRNLGPEMSRRWQAFLGNPDQVVIGLRPTWAGFSDMAGSPFVTGG